MPKAAVKANTSAANLIFIEGTNDGQLYRQQTSPIITNLAKKRVKGNYQADLAIKLWGYLVDSVVKKYRTRNGNYNGRIPYPLDAATKKLAAAKFMKYYSEEIQGEVTELKAKAAAKKKPAKKTARR